MYWSIGPTLVRNAVIVAMTFPNWEWRWVSREDEVPARFRVADTADFINLHQAAHIAERWSNASGDVEGRLRRFRLTDDAQRTVSRLRKRRRGRLRQRCRFRDRVFFGSTARRRIRPVAVVAFESATPCRSLATAARSRAGVRLFPCGW